MAHTIAQRLRELREGRGWSQRHLAKIAGVSQGHVGLIEKGDRSQVTVDVAKKLAVALGVTVDELLTDESASEGSAA